MRYLQWRSSPSVSRRVTPVRSDGACRRSADAWVTRHASTLMVRTTLECMMTAKPSRGEIYYRYFFWVKVEQNVKIGDPGKFSGLEIFHVLLYRLISWPLRLPALCKRYRETRPVLLPTNRLYTLKLLHSGHFNFWKLQNRVCSPLHCKTHHLATRVRDTHGNLPLTHLTWTSTEQLYNTNIILANTSTACRKEV